MLNWSKKGVIKLANKINLSRVAQKGSHVYAAAICLVTLLIAWFLILPLWLTAQVPPRSEAAQEQREEKSPRKEWVFTDDQFSLTPWCTLTFIGKDGEEAVMDFCGETVTYSGELEADEAAKVFFEYLRGYIAACQSHTKEKREE